MSIARGDVVLAEMLFINGSGSKKRPVLVVQSDHNNARMQTTIVAVITTNLSRVHEPTQLLIDVLTPEGAASGLLLKSAVKCENLATIPQKKIQRVIGHLPDSLMDQINECLKAALDIP